MNRLALIAAVAPGIAAAQPSTFHGIGDIAGGPFESAALGVSDDGAVVVGYSIGPAGNRLPIRWTAVGGLENLEPEPPGVWHWQAVAASADGSVIVGSSEAAWATRAFRWTATTGALDLGDLPGGTIWAAATSVSGDGSVVVGASDAGVTIPGVPNLYTAFRWTEAQGIHTFLTGALWSGATDISSDGTTIVGHTGPVAFRWSAAAGMQTMGGEAYASATSANGSVVVGREYYSCGSTLYGPIRWGTGGGCLTWGVAASAGAISADGMIVLISSIAGGQQTALIWDAVHGARPLRDLLESEYGLDLTGWQLSPSALSGDGTVIVGTGVNPCGQTEGWVARLGSPACPPDCNASGTPTIADFGCFQGRFAAGCP